MAKKGEQATGRHAAGVLRPHVWVTGDDPLLHDKYRVFIQQRNQANFRNEEWSLSFETWCKMWEEHWDQRGRTRDSYCMTRNDQDGPWDETNTVVMARSEHHRIHKQRQFALGQTKGYKQRLAAQQAAEQQK